MQVKILHSGDVHTYTHMHAHTYIIFFIHGDSPNDIRRLLGGTLPQWCQAARTPPCFLATRPASLAVAQLWSGRSGPANGNLNADGEGKIEGVKISVSRQNRERQELGPGLPSPRRRNSPCVTSISTHTTQLSNLPGPPPSRLFSPLPFAPRRLSSSSSSAMVAALLHDSCVNDAHNNRTDEAAVGAGRFCCTLVWSHLSVFTNAAYQDRSAFFSIPRLHLRSCAFDAHPDSCSTFLILLSRKSLSLSLSLSILLSADLWEGWVDHLLFGESSEKRGLEGSAGGSQTRLKGRDDVREAKLQLRRIKTQSGGEEVWYSAT